MSEQHQRKICPRCKSPMQDNGKCTVCNYSEYVPMDEKKLRKIRWILGGILLVAFVVILIINQIA